CRDVWSLYSVFSLFFIILFPLTHPPPYSTLFPYTTLFRSDQRVWPDRPGFSPATSRRQRHQLCRSGGRLPVLCQRRALSDRFERSEEHTSELQSRENLVCRLLLEKKKLFPTPTSSFHSQLS